MKNNVKKITRRLICTTALGRKAISIYHVVPYLDGKGWFVSYERMLPIDKSGEPLPWYTYPMISFLIPRIHVDMKVFEYGSGQSTLWWSSRVSRVVSCEHDLAWHDRISKIAPENTQCIYCDINESYTSIIGELNEKFDCIVIDGRKRVECTLNAVRALKDGGVILFDNSDREKYHLAYQFLTDQGYRRLDFWGLGPGVEVEWCTSIFYLSQNCFGI